jgi:hypothetical protein
MPTKYDVSCYGPPSQLVIEEGNTVVVKGWMTGNKIRAESILNETKKGPSCACGDVPKEVKLAEHVTKKGKATNIKYSGLGVQFDLET